MLGGMGFTWEHDAHLHLRRAATLRQLLGGPGPAARLGGPSGPRRRPSFARVSSSRPAVADPLRAELAPMVAEVAAADPADQRRRTARRAGPALPPLARPLRPRRRAGRAAGHRRAAGGGRHLRGRRRTSPPGPCPPSSPMGRPRSRSGGYCPPCGASSCGASSSASPERAATWPPSPPGLPGPRVAGCSTARRCGPPWPPGPTSASAWPGPIPEAPKHEGITYFVVDMRSPGIEVRPLREITGDALFNEVFFDGLFVPDDCVVGPVNGGWRLARTTLANERVSLATSSAFGGALEAILEMVAAIPARGSRRPGHPGTPPGGRPVAGPAGPASHPAVGLRARAGAGGQHPQADRGRARPAGRRLRPGALRPGGRLRRRALGRRGPARSCTPCA